jgi:hypothetical protein
MIPIFLRDLLPRLLLVAGAGWAFYLLEPAFHQHGPVDPELVTELGATGIAATLANLAGVAVLILLAGFVSADRRHGYYRLFFAQPVSPLVFYGVRWGLGVGLAVLAAVLFLVVGQLAAWGEVRGGLEGIQLAVLAAIAYGGLLAFLSTVLTRGDAWVALLLFVFTHVWLTLLGMGAEPLPPLFRDLLTFVLPPQTALRDVYAALLAGERDWGAATFAAGYGAVWLGAAGVVLRVREWP